MTGKILSMVVCAEISEDSKNDVISISNRDWGEISDRFLLFTWD